MRENYKKILIRTSLLLIFVIFSGLIIYNLAKGIHEYIENRIDVETIEVIEGINEEVLEEENIEELPKVESINEIIEKHLDEYGSYCRDNSSIYYMDLISDEIVDHNGDKEFVGASTYKLLLNIVAYENVINGYINLTDLVYYNDSDYEDWSYVQPVIGACYEVGELLDYSIIYSDNIASNMMLRYLGGYYNVMIEASDILNVDIYPSDNIQTSKNLATALKYLYKNKENEHYQHLLEVMCETVYHDRLDKYIPTELVAHKIGQYDGYIHDAGIILTSNPYILVVMTDNLLDSYEFIAELSSKIYNRNQT